MLAQACAEPDPARALALAATVDVASLSEAERVDLLALVGRLERQVAAWKTGLVAAVAGPAPTGSHDDAALAVGCALGLSVPVAADLVATARTLPDLPAVTAAFGRGELSERQVALVARGSWSLPRQMLARFEELILEQAPGQAAGQTRRLVTKTLARLDPAGLTAREAAAKADADVYLTPAEDGTATVTAVHVPAYDAETVLAAVDAYARTAKTGGDERTLGQLRVAALVDWATAYLSAPGAPRSHGRRIRVHVTVDLPTLLGLTDHPAELPSGTMIPAQTLRELIGQYGAELRRLVTDPAGRLLDYATTLYRPGPDLAEAIAARYVTATTPGATSPARTADLDHDTPHAQGGPTAWDNLHPPTRYGHVTKTHGRWHTRLHPDGTVTWTAPTGHTYKVHPHDYRLGP